MSTQFQFELVSPEKIVLSKPAVMVTVPGGEGDFGVLAGHSPLITTVRPGVIEVYADNDNTITDRIFVAGGFAEVTGERCAVLTEEAVPASSLDRAKIEEEAKSITNALAAAKTPDERKDGEAKLAVVKAKLDAIR